MMNSCSLLIDGYTRNVGYNSICWEDNDHILVYATIGAYDDYTTIGGGMRRSIWGGGEIWRINVNTGEKELLMRKKESEYVIGPIGGVHIDFINSNLYINGGYTIYKVNKNYEGWELFVDSIAFPNVSDDEQYLVGTHDNGNVVKYNIEKKSIETIYSNEMGNKVSDYDYDRNLLLINNIKLVDLNTGVETILLEDGETINGYSVDIYSDRYGQLTENYILIDFDTYTSHEYSKVFINIDSLLDKRLVYGLRGKQSPNGDKYAYERVNSNRIEIYNNVGYLTREILFDREQI